ncbi:Solute carrier family 2, facilitated glucose transporter member 8 [Zootermopsis nevadensis]|uniref:Solute carrier family 2, facilitated glucose transporter member 8 n=1 Tax=Zootermopsis nevadensis TaxID=136037 RepID=A0A067QR18_ZOONE|nr:Solute carrier family 2, facilitated glucose transporter member 8 [Zootermopsis nevadensis]
MESGHGPQRNLLTRQLVVSLVAASSTIASGMSLGFSAIALPELLRRDSADKLDIDQASWFASVASIATPFGCLLCGPLLDHFGRRIALLALNVPFVLGWFTLALTPSPTSTPLLYLGRILTGIGTGMASVPACVYIAEVTDHSLRGMLVTWPSIGISAGILVVYTLGAVLKDNWRLVAALAAAFPIFTAVSTLLLLRESPLWIVSEGRGRGQFELGATSDRQEPDNSSRKAGLWRTLRLPQVWKPLFVLNAFFFFQQFSGIYVVVFYAVDIVLQAGVSVDEYVGTVLLGVVQLVAGVAVSFALTRCGRRPMSLLSGAGMTVCMLGLAAYLHLVPNGSKTALGNPHLATIPFVLLLVYVVAGAIGFHTLPWAMLGEMFPPRVKGLAGGLTTCLAYVFSFAALKMYPSLLLLLGGDAANPKTSSSEGVFYFYGAVSLVATLFVALFLTETHRKTLQQVEQEFKTRPLWGKH